MRKLCQIKTEFKYCSVPTFAKLNEGILRRVVDVIEEVKYFEETFARFGLL